MKSCEIRNLYIETENSIAFFDAEEPLTTQDSVVSILSVYKAVVIFTMGQNFANVIGSGLDPKHGLSSWIQLWESNTGANRPSVCSSLDYNGFTCSSYIIGGHVILGTTAGAGTDNGDDVYIIPICQTHNKNDKVDMAAIKNRVAVQVKNYLH